MIRPDCTPHQLRELIRNKQSLLCVGLDPQLDRLPAGLPQNAAGVLAFNEAIIDATLPHAVAYKPNLAFYEALGTDGWAAFEATLAYIGDRAFVIADAKRGDIGNTATQYAKAFFEHANADALTLNPYMGVDTVTPYFDYANKLLFVLALTSNAGADDFQTKGPHPLYERVVKRLREEWSQAELGFVVGATQTNALEKIKTLAPNAWYLVPGVGAQGGNLAEALQALIYPGAAPQVLINASRSILYASSNDDFAEQAEQAAAALTEEIRAVVSAESWSAYVSSSPVR